MTGASEKVLQRAKRPYRKVYVHPTHHAGYYPGAEAMTLKLLFDPQSGKMLGAQAGNPGQSNRKSNYKSNSPSGYGKQRKTPPRALGIASEHCPVVGLFRVCA